MSVTSTEETKHTQFPSALAANPRDANQLLIAYEASSAVFLWDFAKRKVVREFTFAKKKAAPLTRTSTSSGTNISFGTNSANSLDNLDTTVECNSPQTLSWHSSGKRFAAGYKFGGFAVFRADKSQGHYHSAVSVSSSDTVDTDTSVSTAIRQLQWICAPPTSKNAHLAGAILYSGGLTANSLTLVYPPKDINSEDSLSEFTKAEHLAWRVATIPTVNNAEIASFSVACDQVDYCSKIAPLSVLVLSGNPLDGCLPSVSVQPLPCFVRFRANDKEDWEWSIDQVPRACAIPPLLQFSPLSTFAIVNLLHSDGALQDDLFTTWEQETHDPLFQLLASEDFEWPLNGGSVVEPLLSRFLSSSGAFKDEMQTICQNGTLLLTGHANGFVLLWELIAPAERASKGTLHLLHVIDVPLQMAPIPATKGISCLSFCHEARVLVVGFATGEIAVLEFGQWKQRRPSSLLESHFSSTVAESVAAPGVVGTTDAESAGATGTSGDTEVEKVATGTTGSTDTSQLAGASLKDVTGFKTLFTLHIHNQAIQSLSLSTAYGYFAASDTGGVVSLTQIASQAYKLLIFELSSTSEDEPVSVESLLMSELVQATDIPASMGSSSSSGSGTKLSKGSPTRPRRLSRSSGGGAGTDGSFVTQHREVIPVLFVGRGNGKLEMFHVQTGTKMAESLVDRRKVSGLSSIMMVDADGKRIDIPGRVWVEQGDGINTSDDVVPEPSNSVPVGATESISSNVPEAGHDGDGEMNSTARHVRSPSTELEYTKRIVLDVINEQSAVSSGDVVLVQNEERLANATITSASTEAWARSNVIEVIVAAGSSLGLHLFTDIEQHAVVKGFVPENANALMIESRGVHAGHVIMSINGLDLTTYGRHVICGVLEKLRDREKVIVFAEGFNYSATASSVLSSSVGAGEGNLGKDIGVFNDLLGDGANHTDVERPRFLVCTCGKAIHLLQAAIPKASEMASGLREMLAQPLASVELRAAVVTTSVIRVPVAERVENCLVAIDQSNYLYVLSLLSLEVIWEKECFSLGNSFDGIRCEVSYSGELVVANSFGEVERFSFFAEQTAIENALLERKCIKTRLHLQEREFVSDKEKEQQASGASPQKKKSLADKMFKKLVTGLKGDVDLNKVFQFNKEEAEREQLLGDRAAQAKATGGGGGGGGAAAGAMEDGSKKVGKGLGDTKDALMQATQVLWMIGVLS